MIFVTLPGLATIVSLKIWNLVTKIPTVFEQLDYLWTNKKWEFTYPLAESFQDKATICNFSREIQNPLQRIWYWRCLTRKRFRARQWQRTTLHSFSKGRVSHNSAITVSSSIANIQKSELIPSITYSQKQCRMLLYSCKSLILSWLVLASQRASRLWLLHSVLNSNTQKTVTS